MEVRDIIEDFATDERSMLAVGTKGAGKEAINLRKKADLMWRNQLTARNIEERLEKATLETFSTGSGGNINNKIRQVFTKIAADPKQMARFKPAERDAINAVVKQGFSSAASKS